MLWLEVGQIRTIVRPGETPCSWGPSVAPFRSCASLRLRLNANLSACRNRYVWFQACFRPRNAVTPTRRQRAPAARSPTSHFFHFFTAVAGHSCPPSCCEMSLLWEPKLCVHYHATPHFVFFMAVRFRHASIVRSSRATATHFPSTMVSSRRAAPSSSNRGVNSGPGLGHACWRVHQRNLHASYLRVATVCLIPWDTR
jgi:hypothetical protein